VLQIPLIIKLRLEEEKKSRKKEKEKRRAEEKNAFRETE